MDKAIIVAIVIVLVVAGGATYYFLNKAENQPEGSTAPEIISFEAIKPNLVLKGKNLSKVEVWVIPTGTGITEENYSLLGEATLSGTENDEQTWNFQIPQNPILATEIFARAFGQENQKIGDKSLPYSGATDVYNALWGSGNGQAESIKVYDNTQYGFSFSYSARYILKQDNIGYEFVTNNSLARVDLPKDDFSGTNLSEAAFIVGVSRNDQTINKCLNMSAEEQKQGADETINGVIFKVFEGMGAGAGNFYETKTYRTVYNNSCFEAVLFLHSGNIGNYPEGTVKEFDKAKAMAGLVEILNTFKVKQ